MPRDCRGGFPTHWTVTGQGAREAVLIHCSLAHSGEWSDVAARLGHGLRMTAFDLPGHGRSGEWDGRGDYQSVAVGMAADLIEDRADLIGHSFGATVALRLAIEQPGKVRSLTMIEPVFFALAPGDAPGVEEHAARQDVIREAARSGRMDEAARLFLQDWGLDRRWDDLSESERGYTAERMALLDAIEPQTEADRAGLTERFGDLDLPVLILDGTGSAAIMAAVCAEMEARIPGATRQRIAGAGHMSPVTHPDVVADRISAFLGLPASRG